VKTTGTVSSTNTEPTSKHATYSKPITWTTDDYTL
jgi:hypothetical protein